MVHPNADTEQAPKSSIQGLWAVKEEWWHSAECCVFDLDGTLYSSKAGLEFDLIPAMVSTAAEFLLLGDDEARVRLRAYRSSYRSSVIGLQEHDGISADVFLDRAFSKLDVSKVQPYPNLREALIALRQEKILGLFSNSYRTHADRILKLLDIDDLFHFRCTVDCTGYIRKPNVEAFESLLPLLPCTAERTIIFDDSFLNLETAKTMGFKTLLVSNGIADPPMFWEMHKRVYHAAPPCADASTHNLVEFLRDTLDSTYRRSRNSE